MDRVRLDLLAFVGRAGLRWDARATRRLHGRAARNESLTARQGRIVHPLDRPHPDAEPVPICFRVTGADTLANGFPVAFALGFPVSEPSSHRVARSLSEPLVTEYACPVPEPVVAPASARPGRCANHPSVAMVGTCERCGRSVCSACAIPVRGTLIGPECLGAILDEAPSVTPPSLAVPATGDRVAVAGFALVVLISMFPWSRFGDSSRYLGAWTLHWSLAASLAGVAGLVFALFAWRRPPPPLLVVAVEGTLGFIVAP